MGDHQKLTQGIIEEKAFMRAISQELSMFKLQILIIQERGKMTANEIIEIVNAIPDLIQYVYPGAITVYLFKFFKGYSIENYKGFIICSIALSYIYEIIVKFFTNFDSNQQLKMNMFLIILSITCSYSAYRLLESEVVGEILMYLGISTSVKSEEFSLLNSDEQYTYLRIYLKNKPLVYEGYLKNYEKEGKPFVILSQYKECVIDEDNLYEEKEMKDKNFYGQDREWILIYISDIDRIEKCSYNRIRDKENQR